MSLTTASHGDAVRVLSFAFIISQIDTRNREYLISWLQKKSLKQLLFDLCAKDTYFLERTILFVL